MVFVPSALYWAVMIKKRFTAMYAFLWRKVCSPVII